MLYRGRIGVIPNITPAFNRLDTVPDKCDVVLDIGDASPRKNMKTLIQGFQIFRKKVPAYELRLVGAGLSETGEVAEWAKQQSLDGNVRFLGKQSRPEVAVHLAEASIFCHGALEESQPMCLLEAMSAGVPVIAGENAGGVPWTLEEGAAGLLVDVTDSQAIAASLYRLHTDKQLQHRLVSRSQELLNERHSGRAVAEAYLQELERALDPHRHAEN